MLLCRPKHSRGILQHPLDPGLLSAGCPFDERRSIWRVTGLALCEQNAEVTGCGDPRPHVMRVAGLQPVDEPCETASLIELARAEAAENRLDDGRVVEQLVRDARFSDPR